MSKTMKLNDLKKQFPNNYYLGEYVRFNYYEIEDLSNEAAHLLIRKHSNDNILGEKVRTL
jgi:hypothetical protein